MLAPDSISSLVRHFQSNLEDYRNPHYNETQLRQEFINPFFIALGWDVSNVAGAAEAYKPVVHEDAVKVSGATKAPDYSFRIGGTRKFFVETKKPAVRISESGESAFQLRRYAWSAKLALSILTDFEQFAVYDCRVKPAHTDKASAARIMLLPYTDYLPRWEELCDIFSPEAITRGSFDRYAETEKLKKGTARVDDAFLSEIERWRDELARSIAVRNPSLSVRELNFAVQRVIDRIVFLRICEDRGVEEYGRLQALLNGGRVYPRLVELFREADQRYNSGLFHFRPEKDRPEPPDELTTGLEIDDKALKDILKNLYYPDSPYEFSVFSADILGQVYEQFLGKVIRLTAGHHAVVEDKPEVKKAGGVYYTPVYIVEYIVKNTVGKLLSGKTLRNMKQAPIRVLDPACGSGSFLIQAYQYLLDWYAEKYVADGAEKHKKEVYRGGLEGDWRLSTAERKRILLAHIFGVDIDPQAVEVTKLSLLLKVLEGETYETLNRQMAMFHERALPDLGGNIKCGNSLIGSDYFAGKQIGLDDDDEYLRINPFDWEKEFAEIMGIGGFDAVIGNPPWGSKEVLSNKDTEYLSILYDINEKNMNIFLLFIIRSIYWIKDDGNIGLLIPKNFIKTIAYSEIRTRLIQNNFIEAITDCGKFPFVAQEAIAISINKNSRARKYVERYTLSEKESLPLSALSYEIIKRSEGCIISLTLDEKSADIFDKVDQISIKLGEICLVGRGLEHGRNGDIIRCPNCNLWSEKPGKGKELNHCYICPHCGREILSKNVIERKFIHKINSKQSIDKDKVPLLIGNNIDRYKLKNYDYVIESNIKGIDYKDSFHKKPKLLFIRISKHLRGFLDLEKFYALNALNIYVLRDNSKYSLSYILGILNSKLLESYFEKKYTSGADLTIRITNYVSNKLPIRTINFSDPADVARHDRMVSLVETMLSLHKKLPAARTPDEKIILQKQIDTTDRQIDALVYELYGLTAEEIKVVECSGDSSLRKREARLRKPSGD